MKVTKISIHNALGIEDLEFVPGERLTVIRGRNGQGKTSALEIEAVALAGAA